METDPYELDAVQKLAIDRVARDHEMTIPQATMFAVSVASYLSDQVIQGKEVTIGRWDFADIRGLIDTIKLMGVDKG